MSKKNLKNTTKLPEKKEIENNKKIVEKKSLSHKTPLYSSSMKLLDIMIKLLMHHLCGKKAALSW